MNTFRYVLEAMLLEFQQHSFQWVVLFILAYFAIVFVTLKAFQRNKL